MYIVKNWFINACELCNCHNAIVLNYIKTENKNEVQRYNLFDKNGNSVVLFSSKKVNQSKLAAIKTDEPSICFRTEDSSLV